MDDPNKTQPVQPEEEELTSDYANNVLFVGTIWDLKLLFGELSATNKGVDWHTSITLPWELAKLMAYYLDINLAARELTHGTIRVPESMTPPEPPPPSESENNPATQRLVSFIKEHRQKFLKSMK
jgi:hypothetical protein